MKKSKKLATLLTSSWILTIVVLFFYSFTQIDLGLTLTRASWWQAIQRNFQFIGYFKRPLSTGLYLSILSLLFVFYFLILRGVKHGWLGRKKIWFLILITAGILWLSYNAFSYDIFNYIFDAKVITFYQQNPYEHKALDFPGDPMLGFMHWTHRLYPYGPTWLVLTVPLSVLGFQKLLPTMILLKGLAVFGYLISCWAIDKILAKISPKTRLIGLSIFAFSPLVIIETLVSAHNDIWMMALALLGFWYLLEKKSLFAWLMLALSAGVKFATILLFPIFLLISFWQKQKKEINWEKIWQFSFFLMVAAVLMAIRRDELKPWYLLYLSPFLALDAEKKWLFWPVTGLSFGALLHYAPFLYSGNWDPPVPEIKAKVTLVFFLVGIAVYFLTLVKKKMVKRQSD